MRAVMLLLSLVFVASSGWAKNVSMSKIENPLMVCEDQENEADYWIADGKYNAVPGNQNGADRVWQSELKKEFGNEMKVKEFKALDFPYNYSIQADLMAYDGVIPVEMKITGDTITGLFMTATFDESETIEIPCYLVLGGKVKRPTF